MQEQREPRPENGAKLRVLSKTLGEKFQRGISGQQCQIQDMLIKLKTEIFD